jgi:hypothetical protein
MSSSRSSWRDLYLLAVHEEDPETALKKVKLALASIRSRLDLLPTGLGDLDEMREIKAALRHLRSLHKRALDQSEKHDRTSAVAATLRRLLGAT